MIIKVILFVAMTFSLLLSCSIFKSKDEEVPWESAGTKPFWFSDTDAHARIDSLGNPLVHLFYDFNHYLNTTDKSLNFVVLTPVGSKIAYGLDLISGQKFRTHDYCNQKDIWEHYDDEILYPPFTIGFVPRVLDQLNMPQTIYVFGKDDFYKEDQGIKSHRVRVIGGVIEEICPEANCLKSLNWNKRLILIAVDPYDEKFKDVHMISDLKGVVDWDYVKAFMENGNGVNQVHDKYYPGYRVVREVPSEKAIDYTMKNTHIFEQDELLKIKVACENLYDYAWNNLGNVDLVDKEALKKRKAALTTDQIKKMITDKTIDKLDQMIKEDGDNFVGHLRKFVEKYEKEFQTCTDYVDYNYVTVDYKRHWFMTYLVAYFKLYRMGYFYDCHKTTWFNKSILGAAKNSFNHLEELKTCSEKEINKAFPMATFLFTKLKNMKTEYYQYLEYDYGIGGSHERIYSWIGRLHKDFRCKDPSIKKRNEEQQIFPKKIEWEKRMIKRDGNSRLQGVIY